MALTNKIISISEESSWGMPVLGKAKSHNWVDVDNAFGDFDAIKVDLRHVEILSSDYWTQVDASLPSKRKRDNNNVAKTSASKSRWFPIQCLWRGKSYLDSAKQVFFFRQQAKLRWGSGKVQPGRSRALDREVATMFPTFCLAIIKLHVGPSWVSWPMFPINNVFKLHCESNCRHVPHRVSDLAVNSKKVEEV